MKATTVWFLGGKYNLLDILIFPDVMEVFFIHQIKEVGYINGFEIGR
jgi:hypothetical protein